MPESLNQSTGYGPLVADLAQRAVTAARDAAPHQPDASKWQRSLTLGLPAARWLLQGQGEGDEPALVEGCDQLAEAGRQWAGGVTPHFTDGFGHSRPMYHRLLLHLHLRVLSRSEAALAQAAAVRCHDALAQAMQPIYAAAAEPDALPGDTPATLWTALTLAEHAAATGDPANHDTVVQWVQRALAEPGEAGSLRRQGTDEPFDEWTYRELLGLHALDALARVTGRADWRQRVAEVADYHQGHTQPDYTTYQPWALAAFASRYETLMFAEQQLHDVTVHLQTGGEAAALVPALLLADAATSLRDR
jgi:hypothetical protein